MKELIEVTYHFSDGTEVTKPRWLTPNEQLAEARDEEWSKEDLYEFMQKHFSNYDKWLSFAFCYLLDLGLTDTEANDIIDEWANQWSLPF